MASRNSMLEKILEDYPNCNNQTSSNQIKNESSSRDINDLFSSSFLSSFNPQPSSASTQMNNYNRISNLNLPNTASYFSNDQSYNSTLASTTLQPATTDKHKMNNLNLQINKSPNHPKNETFEQLDLNSSKGKFGWSTCNNVSLPILLRKEEKLVPVRIVETKIIGLYSDFLPWEVFSCINIKSFHITDTEAKLLNEINTLHCDNYYGTERFSSSDVVVSLNDVDKLQAFLDTTKKVFLHGLERCDFLGFVQISGISTVIPYIIKESSKSKNQQITQSKSSITSSLSNLSIKKQAITEQSDTISSPVQLPIELKELKNDDLNFLDPDTDQEHTDTSAINCLNDFNENSSLTELEEHNFDHQSDPFINQISSSNFTDSSDYNLEPHIDSNHINNLVCVLDHNNLNSSETDRFGGQFDDTLKCGQQTTEAMEVGGSGNTKFVPCSLIEDHLLINNTAEKLDLNEWDCSYLKMICIYAGYKDSVEALTHISKSLANATNNDSLTNDETNSLRLVSLNDIKCDANQFNPVTIKEYQLEYTPSTNQFNQTQSTVPLQGPINNYLTSSPSVQSSTNNNLNSHHHTKTKSHHSHHLHNTFNQSNNQNSVSHSDSYLQSSSSRRSSTSSNHHSTKETNNCLNDFFPKLSSTNNYLTNLTDSIINNTTNSALGMHLNNNHSSNNNNHSSGNPYQANSSGYGIPYDSRTSSHHHLNNYTTSRNRLNSHHPQSIAHPTSSLQQPSTNRSNYFNNNHLKNSYNSLVSNQSTCSSSTNRSNKNQLFSGSIFNELTKNLTASNGATNNNLNGFNSLNGLNTTLNSRNVLNNCNSMNNQSNLSNTSSGYNFDDLNSNLINNNSNLINNNSNLNRMFNTCMPISFSNSPSIASSNYQSTTGSTNSNNNSYTILTVTFDSIQLKSIILNSNTNPQHAFLLSEIAQKLLNNISVPTARFILETQFKIKFLDCTSAHKHAFSTHGLFPTPDDKLVPYSEMKKWSRLSNSEF